MRRILLVMFVCCVAVVVCVFIGIYFVNRNIWNRYLCRPEVAAIRAAGCSVDGTGDTVSSIKPGPDTNFDDNAFKNLQGLDSLEIVNVIGKPLTGSGLRYLTCLQLKELRIKSNDFDMENLRLLPKFDRLETLDLGSLTPHSFDGGAGLRYLLRFSTMRNLRLCNTGITDSDFEPLLALSGLKKLDLSGTQITDNTLRSLSAFKELEDLELYNTKITADGVLSLANVPSLRFLLLPQNIPAGASSALRKALPKVDISPMP